MTWKIWESRKAKESRRGLRPGASEPGEKDSTGLHRAFKSRPGSPSQTKRLGKLPQNLKERTSGKKRKKKINLPALSRRGVREPITIRKDSGMR